MTDGGRQAGERGSVLLEMAVAAPLLAVLAAAVGTMFLFGVRSYLLVMSDWVLQEQVSYAMERLTADLRYAEDAKAENGRLRVLCREVSGDAHWVEYDRTLEEQSRIRRDRQPLTGQSTLGAIRMQRFEAERIDERTMFLRIVADNEWTGQSYELETAVTWTGKDS